MFCYPHVNQGGWMVFATIQNMKSCRRGGFTLIELLVVIAIIGLLASIILVSLNTSRQKAVSVRVLSQMSQMKKEFEQSYVSNGYPGITANSDHTNNLTAGTVGEADLTLLACDIASILGYPTTVTGDLTLTCNGNPGVRTGVVIYSVATSGVPDNYVIYATTTPGGYVCADSFGHTVTNISGIIPDYASIVSPNTALCQ